MNKTELENRPLVLDGGMATSLESRGHDLSGVLWSARILLEQPLEIASVHESHIAAGADIITTASYQVSAGGLTRAGFDSLLEAKLISQAVTIAKEVADSVENRVLVAASIGPYGATLADGSEYRGDYKITKAELKEFHKRRLEHFMLAEPDLLAFETVPSRMEIEVITELLNETYSELPAWISVSARNHTEISDGTDIQQAFDGISAPNLLSLGVNCTKPEYITSLLQRIETDLPKIVYPNAGRTWDAINRNWLDVGTDEIPPSELGQWIAAGARILGGCCGLAEKQIAAVRRQVS